MAFLAAFDYEEPPIPGMAADRKRPTKRVTYIALAKQTMPKLLQLYLRFKNVKDIYEDGTIESVFSVSGCWIRDVAKARRQVTNGCISLLGLFDSDEAQVRCTRPIEVWF